MNNFSTVHAIFAHISPISAAYRKKFKNFNENTKNSFQGLLKINAPNRDFKQNTLLNNFSLIQPILTNSLPFDSAQQAEEWGNIKMFQISY
jgi:hypothetical protein